jgi:thioredoxin 1
MSKETDKIPFDTPNPLVATCDSPVATCDPPVATCHSPVATCDQPVGICDSNDTKNIEINNKSSDDEPKQPDFDAPTSCPCCNIKTSEIKFSVDNVVKGEVSVIKTKHDFLNILNDANNMLVIVDFTATWCGPCKRIMPELIKLADIKKNENVLFLKVDVDDNEETSSHCGISCMPTFQFYKNNIKVHEIEGADISAIQTSIDRYLQNK